MQVEIVYSPAAAETHRLELALDAGATLQDAVDASGWLSRWPEIATLDCGIWGRRAARDATLREADRVEIYRALRVDPKEARRQRARR